MRPGRSGRFEVATPSGPAQVDLDPINAPGGLLILGHGAGGSVDAPDLLAIRTAVLSAGWTVARITQPYRVAGRRTPAPAARLDEAWLAVTAALARRRGLRDLPTVHAGRSSGARVACRCAGPAGATGVVALAFPVHPPGRPDRSRLSEVAAVTVPLLVVQGDRDAFGSPPGEFFADDGRRLVTVAGADHSLRQNTDAVAGAVVQFLGELAGQIDASRAG